MPFRLLASETIDNINLHIVGTCYNIMFTHIRLEYKLWHPWAIFVFILHLYPLTEIRGTSGVLAPYIFRLSIQKILEKIVKLYKVKKIKNNTYHSKINTFLTALRI